MPEIDRAIWKRRVVLMAVIGLGVAIPLTIALRGGEPVDLPAAIEAPKLGEIQFDRRLGVEMRLPPGWKTRFKGAQLELRSGDGSATIGISAPAGPAAAQGLRVATLARLKTDYKDLKVVQGVKRSQVGGLRAQTTAIAARQPGERGSDLRILLSTARGEKRSYLVLVFAAAPNPGQAIVEAQAVLNDIRFVG